MVERVGLAMTRVVRALRRCSVRCVFFWSVFAVSSLTGGGASCSNFSIDLPGENCFRAAIEVRSDRRNPSVDSGKIRSELVNGEIYVGDGCSGIKLTLIVGGEPKFTTHTIQRGEEIIYFVVDQDGQVISMPTLVSMRVAGADVRDFYESIVPTNECEIVPLGWICGVRLESLVNDGSEAVQEQTDGNVVVKNYGRFGSFEGVLRPTESRLRLDQFRITAGRNDYFRGKKVSAYDFGMGDVWNFSELTRVAVDVNDLAYAEMHDEPVLQSWRVRREYVGAGGGLVEIVETGNLSAIQLADAAPSSNDLLFGQELRVGSPVYVKNGNMQYVWTGEWASPPITPVSELRDIDSSSSTAIIVVLSIAAVMLLPVVAFLLYRTRSSGRSA